MRMLCLICKKSLNTGKKYCSYQCYGVAQQKRIKLTCEICKKEFIVPLSRYKKNVRACSRKCHFVYQSIRPYASEKKHHSWKGGISRQNGYIYIKKRGGFHRFIMEKYIGRKLHCWGIVHHINGIRGDIRLSNLQLTTKAGHIKAHNISRWGKLSQAEKKLNGNWLPNLRRQLAKNRKEI